MGEIEYLSIKRHLTPNVFKVLTQLMNSDSVTTEELYEALRGDPNWPDSAYVRVHVSYLRRALKGFPLRIENYSGYGYRLVRT